MRPSCCVSGVSAFLECRLEGASGSVSARIADLSISGCYVDTLMQVVKDARAAITVTLDGEEIQLTGIVVYVHDKQGFAVRFDERRSSGCCPPCDGSGIHSAPMRRSSCCRRHTALR